MVAKKTTPDMTSQDYTSWRVNLDAAHVNAERIALAFLPQAQDTPNMTVKVLAGALRISDVLSEIAVQNTGTIAAPVGNPRVDRVVLNSATGAVEVLTGTPAASPVAPTIPADRLPICRFQLSPSTTAISAGMIVDERLPTGGTSEDPTIATIVAGEALADRDLIYQDVFNQRGGGADRWYKVDTDAVSPVRIGPDLAIALAAISSGASGRAKVQPGRVAGFSGLTVGALVFASATAGGITQTVPAIPSTGTQNASRRVGKALSATEIEFKPEDDTVFTARNSAVAVDGTITVQHWADAGARDREEAAYLVQVASLVTTASRATGTGSQGSGWTNYGARARVAAAQVSTSGNPVRVTLAATGAGTTFSNVFIGHGVASGNLWEFEATPTRVTFGGGNSAVVGSNATLQSDSIAFALDETKPLVVAMDIGSANPWILAVGSAPTGWNGWTKAGGSGEAGTTAPTGYTNDFLLGLASVEVAAAARDEPLQIGSVTVNAAATDCVNVRYDDGSGANADTRTTFVNRTNATRDMAVEVIL